MIIIGDAVSSIGLFKGSSYFVISLTAALLMNCKTSFWVSSSSDWMIMPSGNTCRIFLMVSIRTWLLCIISNKPSRALATTISRCNLTIIYYTIYLIFSAIFDFFILNLIVILSIQQFVILTWYYLIKYHLYLKILCIFYSNYYFFRLVTN